MTLRQMRMQGQERLQAAGITEAASDAWILLSEILQIDRTFYLIHEGEEVDAKQVAAYENLLERRCQHIPVQYLTGHAPFMGMDFKVTPAVLIPRFDTEILVEQAMKLLCPGSKVLDMCTGSGCIAISLAKLSGAKVTAVDLSGDALSVAAENAAGLGTEVTFLQSDMYDKVTGTYDMIVSNPPYIETAVIEGLDKEVAEQEPKMALDGGEDGLDFYRILSTESLRFLKEGGWLCMEIGADQGNSVPELLEDKYTEIQVIQDLAGLPRVVLARRK